MLQGTNEYERTYYDVPFPDTVGRPRKLRYVYTALIEAFSI